MALVLLALVMLTDLGPIRFPGGPAVDAPGVPAAPVPAGVVVVDRRPDVPGYDRSCTRGHGCVFGPAWSDNVDVRLGRDGCGTRDGVLKEQLTQVVTKAGTGGCVVTSGVLRDPYTGVSVTFAKSRAFEVPVDHVYPLAAAWDLGAARWPEDRRRDFANDPRNLLATTRGVNSAKGDATPGEWLPPTRDGRCTYARAYLVVAEVYSLPVTRADLAALTRSLSGCERPGPVPTPVAGAGRG